MNVDFFPGVCLLNQNLFDFGLIKLMRNSTKDVIAIKTNRPAMLLI